MTVLTPGANAKISQTSFTLSIAYQPINGVEINVSAFLLNANEKVRGDGDMCFYGQTHVGAGAVVLNNTTYSGTGTQFSLDLSNIDPDIEKIAVVMTIHENRATFGQLPGIAIDLSNHGELRGEVACSGMKETALILTEIYRRGSDWKIRLVGQGFENGLPAIAQHYGVDISAPETPEPAAAPQPTPASQSSPKTAPAPKAEPAKAVNLKKISLTKQGENAKISLKKGSDDLIRVTATWVDNGDNRSDNDDLDLRAAILMPDGKMHWLAASHAGSLKKAPYAKHLGDVQQASVNAPGTEKIEINPNISNLLGGPVALVFSVYSAISNGAVSIASLKPVMTIENGGNQVECNYQFPDGKDAEAIYTYVIGTLDIDGDSVAVKLSGLTSKPGSEDTPWIERRGGTLDVTFDGPPVFKKGRSLMARMLGAGQKGYQNA